MSPTRVQRLLQQGLARHQAGRLKQAESFYRQARAVTLKPDYASAWCNLGLVLAERKSQEPLDYFARALAADPKLVAAIVGRGLIFQQSYCLEEAVATYAEALLPQPDHSHCQCVEPCLASS